MANAVYPKYKTSLLTAASNLSLDQNTTTDGPYVALVDTGTYTYSAAHQFYSSLSGVVGTDQRITNPTAGSVSEGTFDGDNVTFTAVTGASVEALVYYRHNSGANTTWRLVLYQDSSVTGLPVTPNGGDITVTFNASGIFTISDRAAKTDVRRVGEFGRLAVYQFRYIGEKRIRLGFMAQEVEKIAPDAVHQFGRFKAVNYQRAMEVACQAR
jgi:hypothetical protein